MFVLTTLGNVNAKYRNSEETNKEIVTNGCYNWYKVS